MFLPTATFAISSSLLLVRHGVFAATIRSAPPSPGTGDFSVSIPLDTSSVLQKRDVSVESTFGKSPTKDFPINIGGMDVFVKFDLGSSSFLPISPAENTGKKAYDWTKSNTAKDQHAVYDTGFGDGLGRLKGVIVTDTIRIGDFSLANVTIMAGQENSMSKRPGGIIGLAPGLTKYQKGDDGGARYFDSFFNTLIKTRQLSTPSFSHYHGAMIKGRPFVNTVYNFGTDPAGPVLGPMHSELVYQILPKIEGHWKLTASKLTFAGRAITSSPDAYKNILIDGGSNVWELEKTAVAAFYAAIQGSHPWGDDPFGRSAFPCPAAFPDVTFDVNGRTIKIPGGAIKQSQFPIGPGECSINILPKRSSTTIWGSVFLANVFTNYQYLYGDQKLCRFGIASLAGEALASAVKQGNEQWR